MQSHKTFCALAADPRARVEQLQALVAEEKINMNAPRRGRVMRPVDGAVNTGNVDVVRWLIEECKVEVSSASQLVNLLELASSNRDPAVLNYLLNPEQRIWLRFGDHTSDLHAHALAGRLDKVAEILAADPLQITQMSLPTKNVFYWALLGEQKSVLEMLIEFSDDFIGSRILIADTGNVHAFFYSMKSYAKINGNVYPDIVNSFVTKIANYANGNGDDEVASPSVLTELRRCLVDQQCFLGELAQQDFYNTEEEPDQSKYFKRILPWFTDSVKELAKIDNHSDADTQRLLNCYTRLADSHEYYAYRMKEDGEDIVVTSDNKQPVEMVIHYGDAINNFHIAIAYLDKIVLMSEGELRRENNDRILEIGEMVRAVRKKLTEALYDYDSLSDTDSESEVEQKVDTDAETDVDDEIQEEKPADKIINPRDDDNDPDESCKRMRLR